MSDQPQTMFEMHIDPGHAWLRVPAAEVEAVGAVDWLSGYSYAQVEGVAHTRFYYLEEDVDAETFRALWARAGRQPFAIRPKIVEVDHPIRQLAPAPKGEFYTFERALALIQSAAA